MGSSAILTCRLEDSVKNDGFNWVFTEFPDRIFYALRPGIEVQPLDSNESIRFSLALTGFDKVTERV